MPKKTPRKKSAKKTPRRARPVAPKPDYASVDCSKVHGGSPIVNNAVIDVIQSRGTLGDVWPVVFNLMYDLFPDSLQIQRDTSHGLTAKTERAIFAKERRLVAAAYSLGSGVGRCYSRAVDPMLRQKVHGSIR